MTNYMKLLSFTFAAVLTCFTFNGVSNLMGQTVTVDVHRLPDGRPELDVNGDWRWDVTYTNGIIPTNPVIEFGGNFSGADVIFGSVTSTGVGGGDVEESAEGAPVFGWEVLNGSLQAFGLQVDPSQGTHGQSYYAFQLGTIPAGDQVLLGTFATDGPSTNGTLTSAINLLGAYDSGSGLAALGSGTHGLIDLMAGTGIAFTASSTITALAGDANLDGVVNLLDENIVNANMGNSVSGGYSDGDLTGDGIVNTADLEVIISNAVPEPGSTALLVAIFVGAGCLRKRRTRSSNLHNYIEN